MRSLFSFLFILSTMSFVVSAETSCQESTYQYQQCRFNIPELGDGQSKPVTLINKSFEGVVGVSCKSGTLNFENAICEAADDGCLISEMEWVSANGNACNHKMVPGVLGSGSSRNVLSNTNDGIISYQCEKGSLSVTNTICNDFDNSVTATAKASQQDISLNPDEVVNTITYESCDVGVLEMTIASSTVYDLNDATCTNGGFTNLVEILYAQPAGYLPREENAVYEATIRCSGNFNPITMCQEGTGETQSDTVTVVPLNCDDARIVTQLGLETGSSPADRALIESQMCNNQGYSGLDSISSTDELYVLNGVTQFQVNAICTGNTNPITRCEPSAGGTSSPSSCGQGTVVGKLENVFPSSEPEPPTRSVIQSTLCTPNGYTNLDQVLGMDFSPVGRNGEWSVEAACSGGNVETCNNPCIGAPYTNTSTRPPIATPDGVFEDMCQEIIPPTGFCQDCDNATVVFSDPNTGNSCGVSNINVLTGGQQTVPFNQSGFSGEVSVSCNNSNVSVAGGSCYKNCQGGELARWADSRGDNSCRATIPDGEYTQGQTVVVNSNIHNGSATLSCNNGAWEQNGPSSCLLDCTGDANWGSGISRSGVNKSGLCRADVGLLKHGQGSIAFNSITPSTTGQANLSCNDGSIISSSESCFIDCRSETGVWGAGRCAGPLNAIGHLGNQSTSTPTALTGFSGGAQYRCDDGLNVLGVNTCLEDCPSGNASVGACSVNVPAAKSGAEQDYTVSNPLQEGRGRLRCSGGTWGGISGSCVDGTLQWDAWRAWANTGNPYNCGAWTPDPSTIDLDVDFTQTRACSINQTRSRDEYRVFTGFPRRDFIRTSSASRIATVNQSQPARGTKPLGPTCVFDERNNVFYESYTDDNEAGTFDYNAEIIINGVKVFESDYRNGSPESEKINMPSRITVGGIEYYAGAVIIDRSQSGGAGGDAYYETLDEAMEVCRD